MTRVIDQFNKTSRRKIHIRRAQHATLDVWLWWYDPGYMGTDTDYRAASNFCDRLNVSSGDKRKMQDMSGSGNPKRATSERRWLPTNGSIFHPVQAR